MEKRNKLFVGNLPYSTTQEELVELFSKYGEVTDSYKPAGKGFAFITFANEEQAQAAIEAMNGADIGGRSAVVNVAQPKEDRPSGDRRPRFGNNNGGQRNFRSNNRY